MARKYPHHDSPAPARSIAAHANATIVAVSHADIIRAALAFWVGTPLDRLLRLEIARASTSGVRFDGSVRRVLWVNDAGADALVR